MDAQHQQTDPPPGYPSATSTSWRWLMGGGSSSGPSCRANAQQLAEAIRTAHTGMLRRRFLGGPPRLNSRTAAARDGGRRCAPVRAGGYLTGSPGMALPSPSTSGGCGHRRSGDSGHPSAAAGRPGHAIHPAAGQGRRGARYPHVHRLLPGRERPSAPCSRASGWARTSSSTASRSAPCRRRPAWRCARALTGVRLTRLPGPPHVGSADWLGPVRLGGPLRVELTERIEGTRPVDSGRPAVHQEGDTDSFGGSAGVAPSWTAACACAAIHPSHSLRPLWPARSAPSSAHPAHRAPARSHAAPDSPRTPAGSRAAAGGSAPAVLPGQPSRNSSEVPPSIRYHCEHPPAASPGTMAGGPGCAATWPSPLPGPRSASG